MAYLTESRPITALLWTWLPFPKHWLLTGSNILVWHGYLLKFGRDEIGFKTVVYTHKEIQLQLSTQQAPMASGLENNTMNWLQPTDYRKPLAPIANREQKKPYREWYRRCFRGATLSVFSLNIVNNLILLGYEQYGGDSLTPRSRGCTKHHGWGLLFRNHGLMNCHIKKQKNNKCLIHF